MAAGVRPSNAGRRGCRNSVWPTWFPPEVGERQAAPPPHRATSAPMVGRGRAGGVPRAVAHSCARVSLEPLEHRVKRSDLGSDETGSGGFRTVAPQHLRMQGAIRTALITRPALIRALGCSFSRRDLHSRLTLGRPVPGSVRAVVLLGLRHASATVGGVDSSLGAQTATHRRRRRRRGAVARLVYGDRAGRPGGRSAGGRGPFRSAGWWVRWCG